MLRYVVSLLILTLSACSLEYEDSMAETLDESIPTSRLYEVKRVQVQGGRPKVSFEADEAVVWEKREQTELFEFVFNEFDEERAVITTGEADYLLISDSNDAEISGNVYGYSSRNEASIRAESLNWLDETRELSSGGDSQVTIEMDNGSVMEGRGFKADMYTNTTSFESGIGGTLESGSEDGE
jgi:LPS export ABC transporter protein LptC